MKKQISKNQSLEVRNRLDVRLKYIMFNKNQKVINNGKTSRSTLY